MAMRYRKMTQAALAAVQKAHHSPPAEKDDNDKNTTTTTTVSYSRRQQNIQSNRSSTTDNDDYLSAIKADYLTSTPAESSAIDDYQTTADYVSIGSDKQQQPSSPNQSTYGSSDDEYPSYSQADDGPGREEQPVVSTTKIRRVKIKVT
jgi:hypothetical protein